MYIIGASTLGEIVACVAERAKIHVDGFYDDVTDLKEFCGKPVLGKIADMCKIENRDAMQVFVAIGDNSARERLADFSVSHGFALADVVDPTAVIEKSACLGGGNLVMSGAYLGVQTKIGIGNLLFPGVSLTHHNTVGNFNFFSPNASIGGHTILQDKCKISMNCCVLPYITVESGTASSPCTVIQGAHNNVEHN